MAAIDSAALDELRRGFRGELLTTQDPGYEDARLVWNAMVDKRPTVIARCASTEDVSRALAFARRPCLRQPPRGRGRARRRVVVASVSSEPELFWGLRGGGGNFGIVTSFEFGSMSWNRRSFRRSSFSRQTMARRSSGRSAILSSRGRMSSATPIRVECREVGPGWTSR